MLALDAFLVLLEDGEPRLQVMHVVVQRQVLVLLVLQVIEFFLEGGDQRVFVHRFGCLFGCWVCSVHPVVTMI